MKTSPNRSIPKAQAERLWAASAGRCNICNTSLLRDDYTGVVVKAGEKAHIVGVGDGPRSPRSNHAVPAPDRNHAENLILLCEKHHTEVDSRPELYSVEHLRELKRKFEERIFFLTSLSPERQTLVLRVVGSIRDKKVPDVTAEQARETVLREEGRYPRFDLSSTPRDQSVDLRELTNEGDPAYWDESAARIKKRIDQLEDLRNSGDAGHVSVFGLARIPVLVQLGDGLGDAADVSVYHRRNQDGWGWDPTADLPDFELVEHHRSDGEDVVLMCSLTATVRFDRAPAELAEMSRYEIRARGTDAGHTLLDHPEALSAFAHSYREFLSMLETEHPSCDGINLLPAIPTDAAVALGRIRTPGANPPLRVYDLNKEGDSYDYACEIG